MKTQLIEGKFQAGEKFGFVIPDERDFFGWDFYIKLENFNGAVNGNRVVAQEVENKKWKKPEAKIIEIVSKRAKNWEKKSGAKDGKVFIEGIYSGGDGNFGFIDVVGQEKWFFVYGLKKNGAQDGDKVVAEVVDFNGKKEAIVSEILEQEREVVQGVFQDRDRFGFVISDDKEDIFIAGSRKNNAKDGERVVCEIIKRWGKNPEGVIRDIIK